MKTFASLAVVFLLMLSVSASAEPVWVKLVPPDPNNPHTVSGKADAEADIANGTMKLKNRGGLVTHTEASLLYAQARNGLLEQYGVTKEESGCIDPPGGELYVEAYNARITKELETRHGAGFLKRFEAELSSRLASNQALQPTGPASGGSGG